jgi:4-carboxymuconolactone decarboxylase
MSNELRERGSAMRRKLVGDERYQRSMKTTYADPVMREFVDVTHETVFGVLWARPGLSLKMRTFVCVISDVATGHLDELEIHLRMALREGWTAEELKEALLHLIGYLGVPSVRGALLVASKVFKEL